jgi:hypothetical protein
MPEPIVNDCTEQLLLLDEFPGYVEGPGIIRARDIIPSTYVLKSWKDYIKETDWTSIL